MIYIILALMAIILVLGIAFAIAAKIAAAEKKSNAELKAVVATQNDQIAKMGEYHAKKEEIGKNAEAKKDSLRTGDAVTDFNNSINMLHGASKSSRGG